MQYVSHTVNLEKVNKFYKRTIAYSLTWASVVALSPATTLSNMADSAPLHSRNTSPGSTYNNTRMVKL